MSIACLFATAAGLGFPPRSCLSTGVRRFAHDHIDAMTDPKPRGIDAHGNSAPRTRPTSTYRTMTGLYYLQLHLHCYLFVHLLFSGCACGVSLGLSASGPPAQSAAHSRRSCGRCARPYAPGLLHHYRHKVKEDGVKLDADRRTGHVAQATPALRPSPAAHCTCLFPVSWSAATHAASPPCLAQQQRPKPGRLRFLAHANPPSARPPMSVTSPCHHQPWSSRDVYSGSRAAGLNWCPSATRPRRPRRRYPP